MIKNIVFDMGGVLIHFKPAALLAHFDISPADRDLMLKEAFGSVAWIQLDRGTISAGEALEARFRDVLFGEAGIPVLFNCLGREKGPEDSIPALLVRQVQSSVYMEDSIRRMADMGLDAIVEIGPGKALCGFFKKTAPGIKTYHIDTAADFHSVVSALKGATA